MDGAKAETPVLRNPDPNSTNYVNWYAAQLTAFAVAGSTTMPTGPNLKYPPRTVLNDYRMRGEIPMNPGESRVFTLREFVMPPDYVRGASYPQSTAIAAIYADGTTFGDAKVLKAMLLRRRQMIEVLTDIGTTLCQQGVRGATLPEVDAALDAGRAQEDARSDAGKEARGETYYLLGKRMTGGDVRRRKAPQAIKYLWDWVNRLRTGLSSDPVKDDSGQLAIPTAAPLQCNLPS